MGGALRDLGGGIVGLLTLPREQWQAIEADLLDRGFTVADLGGRVSWRALNAMVTHSRRGSALFSTVYGEAAEWGAIEHLAASLLDVQQIALWLKTQDGHDGNNRPAPVRRPGHATPQDRDAERIASEADAIPMDEWNDWWNAVVPTDDAGVTI